MHFYRLHDAYFIVIVVYYRRTYRNSLWRWPRYLHATGIIIYATLCYGAGECRRGKLLAQGWIVNSAHIFVDLRCNFSKITARLSATRGCVKLSCTKRGGVFAAICSLVDGLRRAPRWKTSDLNYVIHLFCLNVSYQELITIVIRLGVSYS